MNISAKSKVTKLTILAGSLVALAFAGTAFAQSTPAPTTPPAGTHSWGGMTGHMPPGVFGTVSAVSGDTLTVTSKGFGKTATPMTYSVDATNATVTKANVASSVGAIAVGDMVMVSGTVSGTSVTATTIRDGIMMGMRGQGGMKGGPGGHATSTPIISGNGDPVIGGNVTAVSGDTLTVATTKGNVTYSVDASSATIEKNATTTSVASITVGDSVLVQGTVSGTSVTASSVLDSGAAKTAGGKGMGGGFMGAIGGLFHRIFGFF